MLSSCHQSLSAIPSQCACELTKEELLSLVMGPKTVDFGVVSVSSVTTQYMMMINTLDRCACQAEEGRFEARSWSHLCRVWIVPISPPLFSLPVHLPSLCVCVSRHIHVVVDCQSIPELRKSPNCSQVRARNPPGGRPCQGRKAWRGRRRSDFTVRLEATGPIGLRILYLMHNNAYSSSYSCWVQYALLFLFCLVLCALLGRERKRDESVERRMGERKRVGALARTSNRRTSCPPLDPEHSTPTPTPTLTLVPTLSQTPGHPPGRQGQVPAGALLD